MNIYDYTLRNTSRTSAGLLFSLILMAVPLHSMAEAHKKNLSQNSVETLTETLVKEVLNDTEQSLSLVESSASDALQHVENALSSLREIKNRLSPDTHVESKSPLMVGDVSEYWYLYPQVHQDILSDNLAFPTLHSKLQSGLLDQSEVKSTTEDEIVAYFDYAFAYSSLKMAREALMVSNYREATSTLKWVFDAIYINPGFNVVGHNTNIKIDKLFNMYGKFPYISNDTRQLHQTI